MHLHTQVPSCMLFTLCLESPTFNQTFILQGLAHTFQVFHNPPSSIPNLNHNFSPLLYPQRTHIFATIQIIVGALTDVPVHPVLCLSSSTEPILQYCIQHTSQNLAHGRWLINAR